MVEIPEGIIIDDVKKLANKLGLPADKVGNTYRQFLAVFKSKQYSFNELRYRVLVYAYAFLSGSVENARVKITAGVIADVLTTFWTFKTFTDTREILLYNNGRYSNENGFIAAFSELVMDHQATNHSTNEIYGHIERLTLIERSKFDQDIEWISVRNCMVNVLTRETESHSPEYLTTIQLPITYVRNAECPTIMKFLSEVLDEDEIEIALDHTAYCLWRAMPYHKILICLGTGNNGKSTLFKLIKNFLGSDNVSHVALQDFDNNRFATAELHGKLANIYADIAREELVSTGKLKMLSGDDWVPAEKKFKNQFKFKSFAKLTFSANQLPFTYDDTDAFFRRWNIINFTRKFEGKDADPSMIDKISTEQELAGLFNACLRRLPRILKEGIKAKETTVEQIRERYMANLDSVDLFYEEAVEQDVAATVRVSELYEAYKVWCQQRRVVIQTDRKFGRILSKHYGIKSASDGHARFYRGVSLTQEWQVKMLKHYVDNVQSS